MKQDIYKEKISWYKLIFTISSAAITACIGWLVSNINFPIKSIIVLNILSIIAISFGLAVVICKIRYYFNKLGKDNV